MRHGSLFSGIGGFDLAAEWMWWDNIFHCEWNPFGQRVLKHYFPNAISYHDITKTDFTIHRGQIDLLSGGFPCQPYSTAGKRLGKEDERHLWPEMLRAIREIRPTWVVGENVFGLVNWNGGLVFEEVQADLEAEGYEVQPYVLPACAVNAPHRRDRIWFVAYADHTRRSPGFREVQETDGKIPERNNDAEFSYPGDGISSNTPSDGLNDKSSERHNSIRQDNQQSGTQRKCTFKGFGDEWTSSDSKSARGGILRDKSSEERSQDSNELFGSQCGISGDEWDATNTCNEGLQGSENNRGIGGIREKSHQFTSGCVRSDWQNFPTQSPICTGNDGLSSRLDRITFSKWRNESIKAGGNAIVPQVALQIFKAIEEFNKLT